MYFSPYHYSKDPLNLRNIDNEGYETGEKIILSPEQQKLKEIAQKERIKKAKSFTLNYEREAYFQLRQMIVESTKTGIFPLPIKRAKQIESEISIVLDTINKKLQISDLSIFVMTKLVCYKFYLLHCYDKLRPNYIVPAAFLLSAKLVCKTYHQSNCKHIFDKLINLKFVESNESLIQSEQIIIKTLNPHMAYLEDPVKIIAQLCQERNLENNIQQRAYTVLPTLEPIKFQTWLPKDIAIHAIDIAVAYQKSNPSKLPLQKNYENNNAITIPTEFTIKIDKNNLHDVSKNAKTDAKLQQYSKKEGVSKAYENIEKPYICIVCNRNFGIDLEKFLEHYEICDVKVSKKIGSKPPYKCGICNKGFNKYRAQCIKHQKKCELKHENCKFKCDCGKLFATKFTLERHRSSIHKDGNYNKLKKSPP